ncbi:MAG: hypothetical protein QOI35_2620, partial [Cryptosporangiaceae bacterium]|nr:hypothetical protein [Cryptosporangiaceae bacterium]
MEKIQRHTVHSAGAAPPNRSWWTRRRALVLSASAAVVAAFAVALPVPSGHAAGMRAAAPHAVGATGSRRYTVTLITGDRVNVQVGRDSTPAVEVVKAPGRELMAFATQRTKGGGVAVVPADALDLIGAGKLDERLFDVVLLHQLGYDDAHATDVPVMVSGSGSGKAPSLAGARTVRTIGSLNVSSVKIPKRGIGAVWGALTRPGAGSLAPSVGKVRLVGKLKPTLDVSAAQVGAPAAWAAGYTGKGVRVAVLDTGIDAGHPDLNGVVIEAKDFTGSPAGVKDEVGHGTHVAGTIAGRGTASGGKYTGIAKDAEILSGKVCTPNGCAEDAILAGMEWAAASGAKVVNMSLGGPAPDAGDLLADAVDFYTERNNVLFVVAAGNDGRPETIGSPGTADRALTVGSVDKTTDALSVFSSQGPRVTPSRRLDYAVKPDITAPGRDIVSARAAGTLTESQVGEAYARLSGTSMATPHVAGAAAILAAEHPDWNPATIKDALTSSSKAIAGQTVYQQGAGRLDVARATAAPVTATGVLSLGYFPWPHGADEPASRTVTYSNHGTAPVTLRLDLAVTDDKGKAAARGLFTVGARTVTVPAGKTATAAVTVSPKAGPVGLYGGGLSATSADGKIAVHTAIGAYSEPESYNVSAT